MKPNTNLLVTGGAGFIGSHFVELAVQNGCRVVVLDALTYAGHKGNLEHIPTEKYQLIEGNICDDSLIEKIFKDHKIDGVINFAAESHVDRSIVGPSDFIQTNIVGTFNLLRHSLAYWEKLPKNSTFRFLQVSTDEVFGELDTKGYFTESTPYGPRSPYSASKASADHLVHAWNQTYSLPTIITNCSNNYGPRQFPEKLIPVMIQKAINKEKLTVYGKGQNIRDWIHVKDHTYGIWLALTKGLVGQSYCFGGQSERKNIDVVKSICNILDEIKPLENKGTYSQFITYVEDRRGHDYRYAIDDSKAVDELNFVRKYHSFESGLFETVNWYLNNQLWCEKVRAK